MDSDAREIKKFVRTFEALSVDNRLKILKLITNETKSVQAISEAVKLSSSAVSSHLRILRSADLVVRKKKGHFVLYRLNGRRLEEYLRRISEFFSVSSERKEEDKEA